MGLPTARWWQTFMIAAGHRVRITAIIAIVLAVWLGVPALAPIVPGSRPPVYPLTQNQRSLIERVVAAEARGEPFEGIKAVAQVILDRLLHPRFPNALEGVLREFASPYRGYVGENIQRAVREVFDYGERVFEGNLLYFMNPSKASPNGKRWILSNCEQVLTIGAHIFYN